MISDKNTRISFAWVFAVGSLLHGAAEAQAPATRPADTLTLQSVKIQGSLDLENGVPIRWKKPDGSGYINIFMVDKNGTLQLCHDPFFFEQGNLERAGPPSDPQGIAEMRRLERQHQEQRVIEVRNPNSAYPDLRLPITRHRPGGKGIWDADSKLMTRSATFIETNDPAELNLIRTGDDAKPVKHEDAPVKDGATTGILRFQGRSAQADPPGHLGGYTKDAEIRARKYGTSEREHYGAILYEVYDNRYPEQQGPVMLMMNHGVRVGHDGRKMAGVTGAMLEVDLHDDRPVILRRSEASTTQPVALALATGKNGTSADAQNSLALIKAAPVAGSTLTSRVEIQTNKGNKLESDWVLPVPAAQVSLDADQRIPSGEIVALAFNQKQYDSDSIRSDQSTTRLTCRTAGRYAISAAVEFSANGKGSRQVIVRLNGKEQVAAMRVPAVDAETTQITFTAPPIELNPDDYVELLVRQTSGQTMEVPAKGELPPRFSMTRVG
jgi:hypothetical protein